VRALLQLSFVYRELGDLYLASVIARECHLKAVKGADEETVAAALNAAGIIEEEQGHPDLAAVHFRSALDALRDDPRRELMRLTVQANLGGALTASGHFRAGVVLLKQSLVRARAAGFRRAIGLCLTKLARCHASRRRHDLVQRYLRESDEIAEAGEDRYYDLLFLNAYIAWELAREARLRTQERILFGRLKYLRSLLESRSREVDEFDAYVRGEKHSA
jgi:tetratricopeptide (TPR) repeat protein